MDDTQVQRLDNSLSDLRRSIGDQVQRVSDQILTLTGLISGYEVRTTRLEMDVGELRRKIELTTTSVDELLTQGKLIKMVVYGAAGLVGIVYAVYNYGAGLLSYFNHH